MTFPIVLARLSAYANRGALIGRATAVNTLASIAGSLVGGFVLVPGWARSARAAPSPSRTVSVRC